MTARISLLIVGATMAGAAPAFADSFPPEFAEVSNKNGPTRRLPPDAGLPDALIPGPPQPTLTPSAKGQSTSPSAVLPNYAAREQDAKDLEQFRGGEGVSLYIGGGVLTAIAIVALIVILL